MIRLDSNIVQLLTDFYNQHQEDLYCIGMGGSASLLYIEKPHDIDIILTGRNTYLTREKIHQYLELSHQIKAIDSRYQIINRLATKYDEAFEHHWPIYAYMYTHPQIIVGSMYNKILQFDILEYPERIGKTMSEAIKNAQEHKYFYHLLTDLYILINQSYDLTEEQTQNICIVHDQQDQEKIEELYQGALQQIQE